MTLNPQTQTVSQTSTATFTTPAATQTVISQLSSFNKVYERTDTNDCFYDYATYGYITYYSVSTE